MVDPFKLFQQRRDESWLIGEGVDRDRFSDIVDRSLEELQQFDRAPTVLLCESDPVKFLARFLAACIAEVPVFLGNPNWRDMEWQQVREMAVFDRVWGTVTSEQSLPNQSTSSSLENQFNPKQNYIIISTGGSSGKIKFVVHTWETLCTSVEGFQQHFNLDSVNCCCTLPLFHVSGLMQFVRSFVTGGTLAIFSYKSIELGKLPDLEPEAFWISLVPTQLQRLLHTQKTIDWLSRFQGILLGGAPAWQSLLDKARRNGLPVALTYGMTETASQVVTLPPQEFLKGNFSSGQVLPHAEVSICNECGKTLPTGEVGSIEIRAKSLMLGYYDSDSKKRFDRRQSIHLLGEKGQGNVLKTDDLGYFDDRGFLHVLGRNSQKIITGGENVFPIEVENAIRSSALVRDVCVIGLPDSEWGQIVAAVYVPQPNVTPEQLKRHLSRSLCAYKHPKRWIVTHALPRNERGKVDLLAVRALAESD